MLSAFLKHYPVSELTASILDGGLLFVDTGDDLHIKLGLARLEGEKTVLLLLDIGQLGVAKTHD